MKVRFRHLGIAAAIAAVALVPACSAPAQPDEESVLRIGHWGGPTFDPEFDYLGYASFPIAATYDCLFIPVEGSGLRGEGLEPAVGTEWSYNEGNTVLSITLRDDVVFTDGSPLDAEAVRANIESDSVAASAYLAMLEEIVVVDDHHLEFHLSEPDALFLFIIATTMLVNPASLDDDETLASTPAGSGPYLVNEVVTGAEYEFVRNPDYWDPEAYPYDRIELTVLSDITARVNALKSGQVDFVAIDPSTAAEVESAGFSTYSNTGGWVGLVLGDRRGEISPPIGDVRVRRAISMALDRVGYDEAVQGEYGSPSNQMGVEGQSWFYDAGLADENAYDLDAARDLLAEAGYPDGFDIDIPYWPAQTPGVQPYLAQAMADLGVRVNWIELTNDQGIPELSSGKYAVQPFSALTLDFAHLEPDGFWNPWGNTDAETERLLNTIAAGTTDEANAARQELNAKIVDEVWFAVLAHEPAIWAFTSDITVTSNDWARTPLKNIRPAD
jgi:peptide/nickel transport system substrate-binding protein